MFRLYLTCASTVLDLYLTFLTEIGYVSNFSTSVFDFLNLFFDFLDQNRVSSEILDLCFDFLDLF